MDGYTLSLDHCIIDQQYTLKDSPNQLSSPKINNFSPNLPCGYYYFNDNNQCSQCEDGCLICLSKSRCKQAIKGYYTIEDKPYKCNSSCADCTYESNKFEKVSNAFLPQFQYLDIQSSIALEDCKTACQQNFQCQAFNYQRRLAECALLSGKAFDQKNDQFGL